MFTVKTIVACTSVLWTTFLMGTYIRAIYKQGTKPHLFSWFIWGLLSIVAGAAQLASDAGLGAWTTIYSGVFCMAIAGLSLKHGEKQITKSDWLILISALAAIPLWLLADNPLAAVMLVAAINCAGFVPTFRKAYPAPYAENMACYAMAAPSGLMMLGAMESYTLTTALYPVVSVFANASLAAMLFMRRRYVRANA